MTATAHPACVLSIGLGNKVRLRACHDSAAPGTVIRSEPGTLTVFWPSLDYWSRHPEQSLELAGQQSADSQEAA